MTFKKLAKALATAAIGALMVSATSAEELSLEGKTIGVTVVGTSHHWDLQAYKGQIEELERLGAEVIALDAERNDQTQINQIQTLIAQQPDAIIQQLGNIKVLDPWLKRISDAGIPLFTVDTITEHSVNNTTSNNYGIGSDLALQIAEDMGGEGKILVFNGFYSVPVCKIRYDQLKYVMSNFSGIEMIEPELKDVAPNTVQQAFADVTDMLTKFDENSGLKAVWACWDRPSVGATQAIEKAGRNEVKVYGIDGSPDFVEMILDPNSPAQAVAAQQPYEIGKGAAQNVAKYLNGQDIPPVTFVPAMMINKANASEVAADFLPKN
ncbi:sugar ABC transporter substrate-binding protein [Hoeflea prorocentri]|uniref:Sugar ABC transporter substrate-binding protein n=1 Tax=Hoeflea prorocentri TaxID=1922333 RepID=A0A9X3UIQ4_9HYPH|nr:sugar ABC transporter substrate-binding protein [Hoeflea prorocentri]MCY6381550.1 sugar ABC transporter substrate-binding protein [Hoeflea prorocentri]MDA5399350.1 sugar ABC transporter substrate-binding protein [Hoeflea prorocentri]